MTLLLPRATGISALLGICCCVMLNACSKGSPPVTVHRISGTLSVNGSPAPNLIIHFVPAKGRPSTGVTDARGVFEMRYEKDVAGAIPGEHKVWIEYRPATPAEEIAMREGKSSLSNDVLAALQKYGSAATSPLKVTVDGPKQDLKIEM